MQGLKTASAKLFILTSSLIGLAGLTTGCAHSLRDEVQQELATWYGKHPDQLVTAWGAPQSSYTMENGSKVMSYQDISITSRSMGYGPFFRPEIYSFSDTCRINFFTDPTQKKIESATSSGSASVCRDLLDAIRRSQQRTHSPANETESKDKAAR